MSILARFDSWVASGPFTPLDLGIYRILYAVCTLCVAPSILWLAEYPDSLYSAPFGPFQLLSGFPEWRLLVLLEILRTGALVMLALGICTKWAGFATGVLLLITYGLTYALGKIDHTILLVITPLILSFARWGDRLSVDALLHRRVERVAKATPQWPLRYLALCVGLSFFVAAAMKLATGWLDLSSQAVRGYAVQYFFSQGRSEWLSEWAVTFTARPLWEALDWVTVFFEFALLAAIPWWRAFRSAIAMAALFHLGVFLVMNITFTHNLIPYGAFVAWGTVGSFVRLNEKRIAVSRLDNTPRSVLLVSVAAIVICLTAVSSIISGMYADVIAQGVNLILLFAGGIAAICYLLKVAFELSRAAIVRSRKGCHRVTSTGQ